MRLPQTAAEALEASLFILTEEFNSFEWSDGAAARGAHTRISALLQQVRKATLKQSSAEEARQKTHIKEIASDK